MSRFRLVPLGEFLTLALDEVVVRPDETYQTAGIYSFGRGLFARPPFLGAETKYRSLFRLRNGQFVFSRLNAWEGALAVVPAQFDGMYVSAEYPTFDVDSSRAISEFLGWICRWPALWEELTPKGSMVRRKRSHPEQVMTVEVPLPESAVQRSIALWLDSVAAHAEEASLEALRAAEEAQVGWWASLTTMFSRLETQTDYIELTDAADINPESIDPNRTFGGDFFAYVDITAVGKGTGRIDKVTRVQGTAAPSRARRRIRAGDILISTVRPNLRAFAIVPKELDQQVCSTGFAVLRPKQGTDPRFLLYQALSDNFLKQLTGSVRGGHYPAVNDAVLRRARILRPPVPDQRRVVDLLDGLRTSFEGLIGLGRERNNHLAALVPATLHRILTA